MARKKIKIDTGDVITSFPNTSKLAYAKEVLGGRVTLNDLSLGLKMYFGKGETDELVKELYVKLGGKVEETKVYKKEEVVE